LGDKGAEARPEGARVISKASKLRRECLLKLRLGVLA
jgi:hypothetical protein